MFDSHTSSHCQKILKNGDCLAKISRLHLTTPNFGQNILLEIRAILKWQVVAVPYKDPRTQPRGEELLASPSPRVLTPISTSSSLTSRLRKIQRNSRLCTIQRRVSLMSLLAVWGAAAAGSTVCRGLVGGRGPAAGPAVIKSILFTHRRDVG